MKVQRPVAIQRYECRVENCNSFSLVVEYPNRVMSDQAQCEHNKSAHPPSPDISRRVVRLESFELAGMAGHHPMC
jgi:hypothetical protein